jgi:hypothetical protein
MLRQNRGIGKRPPECQVPCNVKTQSDGDRLAQTVVCRDEPSRDRGRRRTIDSDLSERQVDGFGPRGLRMLSRTTTAASTNRPVG